MGMVLLMQKYVSSDVAVSKSPGATIPREQVHDIYHDIFKKDKKVQSVVS